MSSNNRNSAGTTSSNVDNNRKRKRKRASSGGEGTGKFQPAWKKALELPKFLDASATVSVTLYGARRLPEIKALWKQTTTNNDKNKNDALSQDLQRPIPTIEPLKSTGGKTSSRHLRRRTTSHKARKRHRYPRGRRKREEEMKEERNGENQDQQPAAVATSRRAKRKYKSSLCAPHETWWKNNNDNNNISTESNTVDKKVNSTAVGETGADNEALIDEKTRKVYQASVNTAPKKQQQLQWMGTHLWHTKRFHMAPLWGWQVPLMHTNRGAKAALRLIREGKTLLQDVTWKLAQQPIVWRQTNGMVKDPATELSQLQTLQQSIQRICPEFSIQLPTVQNESNTSQQMIRAAKNISTGQGMLYQVDQFPHQPIGPVTWVISRQRPLMLLNDTTEEEDKDTSTTAPSYLFLYFWVHPAIHSIVVQTFHELFDKLSESIVTPPQSSFKMQVGFGNNIGMARFQLRGRMAIKTLKDAIINNDEGQEDDNIDKDDRGLFLMGEDENGSVPPHGTAFSIHINNIDTNKNKVDTTTSNAWVNGRRVLLVSQCLRDLTDFPQNAPAIGWDILCDIHCAKQIFLSLVLSGQACPIGIVEEAYVNLECDPPIAQVFPRDYPETEQGRLYWCSSNNHSEDNMGGNANRHHTSCKILRLCLEKGHDGGRVPIPDIIKRCSTTIVKTLHRRSPKVAPERLESIPWNKLVRGHASHDGENESDGSAEDPANENVIVMRGVFCQPLLDALSGCAKLPPQNTEASSSKKSNRRKRRRVKCPNEFCYALPLSKQDTATHLETCVSLLRSLSLPAIVACHIIIVGSGTLPPGATIRAPAGETNTSPILLGFISAGAFSTARGGYHGIGMVGASRLLKVITAACQQQHTNISTPGGAFVVQHQSNNSASSRQKIQLQVNIMHGQGTIHKAMLSLLL